MLNKEIIEKVKQSTNICNTFSCYENCEQCVENMLKNIQKERKDMEVIK